MYHSKTYSAAGVDTKSGGIFVARIKKLQNESKGAGQGPFRLYPSRMNFAALMDISFLREYSQPLLLSAADGVGTKLHLAQLFDYHKSVGIDLVGMCTNDLLCSGAKPVQFLDYIACGKLRAQAMEEVIEGILKACSSAGCILAGGETAEHPDIMKEEQYDLAGFALGILEARDLIDGSQAQVGDKLLAIPSSGIHSNGLSLVRKLYLKDGLRLPKSKAEQDFLFHKILVPPTVIYETTLRPLLEKERETSSKAIRGIAHITGGGFFENIPRILKKDLAVRIQTSAWEPPEIFQVLRERARLSFAEMLGIFNMGFGMALIISRDASKAVLDELKIHFKKSYPEIESFPVEIGEIIPRKKSEEALILS